MTQALRARLWMLGSIFAFSAMALAGKEVTPVHDSFEIMTIRSAVGVVLVLILALATGQRRAIRAERLGAHFLRNILHFTGQNLWFFALTLIPLAQLFALEFTSPIWLLLLSVLFLGERLTLVRVASVALGFVGILIVTRPSVETLNIGVCGGVLFCLHRGRHQAAHPRATDPYHHVLAHRDAVGLWPHRDIL